MIIYLDTVLPQYSSNLPKPRPEARPNRNPFKLLA
jgi:hypothetical protein